MTWLELEWGVKNTSTVSTSVSLHINPFHLCTQWTVIVYRNAASQNILNDCVTVCNNLADVTISNHLTGVIICNILAELFLFGCVTLVFDGWAIFIMRHCNWHSCLRLWKSNVSGSKCNNQSPSHWCLYDTTHLSYTNSFLH